MKILHISTSDTGGAANACIRLHLGLLELGVDSKVLVFLKKRNIPEVYQLFENKKTNYYFNKFRYFRFGFYEGINRISLFGRKKGHEIFTSPKSLLRPETHPLFKCADIINLHWVAYFINYKTFFKDKTKKYVWTLHDMNPFTGGCHYSEDCDNFKNNCSKCPQIEDAVFNNLAKNYFIIKRTAFSNIDNFCTVSPSTWLRDLSCKSKLFSEHKNEHISNGHNESIFKPSDKTESRKKLNLPINNKILLFIADNINNQRKGFNIMIEAFKKLNNNDVLLCIAGSCDKTINIENIVKLGFISNEDTMSELYSACDAYVLPTRMDNLPNTIIESQFCGTPVIAFSVGGVPEMIEQGVNGILCTDTTSEALSTALNDFLQEKYLFDSNKIREIAVSKYCLLNQARRYLELYKSL